MSYATQLKGLHDAVLGRHTETAWMAPDATARFAAATRIAVYADGYVERLTQAVMSDYPALAHYLGHTLCEQLVREWVAATPSHHWDLNLYPFTFAVALLQRSNDPAAHALAQLEATIAEVFWLPDSAPITAEMLMPLSPEELGAQWLRRRTASRLLKSEDAANVYLTAYREGHAPASIAHQPEHLLVIRHQHEVRRLTLEPMEYEWLATLDGSRCFDDTLTHAPEALAAKLPEYLARALANGVLELAMR